MYEIDFDVQEESKYTIGNNREKSVKEVTQEENKPEIAQFSPFLATF